MYWRLFLVWPCLLCCPLGLDSASPDKPKVAKPYLPGHRIYLTHRHGWHRVEYKLSAWNNIPVRDQQTAKQIARHYRANGWTTQIVQPSKGSFVVKAKIQRWRLATYSAHRRTADSIAGLLRAQGYQARVR